MANYTSTHTGAVIDASVTKVSASGVTQADFTKLNAVTSSATELNLLDGVTSTTAEINILDGVTSTAAEINILDGATLSVTELNYLDGADSSITTLSLPDNTTITVFGASLIDDANASTARSTLNVDVAGTDNSTNVTLVTTSYDYLSLSGQAITLGQIDISDDTNLVGGTGITLTGDTLSTTDGDIVHDSLSGFVANEHIDHSTVTLTAGDGLSGGGDITTNRSFSINVDDASIEINSDTLRVKASGITNDMLGGSIANAKLSNSSVSYGGISLSLGGSDATPAFDLSDATSLPIIAGTTGTLTVARGGTGATTASGARTNLNVDVAGTDNSTDVTLVTTSHDYLSLSGQAVTLGQIDISDDTNLVGGTGITLTGDTLSTTDSEIVHDNLSGFVSNEHIDHSTVSITAGTGLSGGGDITSTRTLTTDDSAIVHDNLSGFVANEHIDHSGVSITAGAGLTGGGDITATRDIAVGAGTGVTVNADDIAIGQDVGTNADVTFNSVTSDDFIGSLNGAVQFEAKATVALNKGDAVYVVGISGNTPTIAIADSNDAAKMPSFGLAASSASINDVIEVVTFGTLKNINTSSFSEGDVLFISSNGTSGNTLTATKEAGESVLCQNIGKVIRSHATVGSIKVGGAGRANATPNLNDGNIFIGNGSNQAVTAALNTKIEEYLSAGTSTANFDTISIDGTEITATATELNKMDGVTSTTAEINYTDGVTSNIQTQLNLKAPLASPAFTGTATGANLTLSGDLTVNGSTTTLDTTNLAVEDNLMELNAGVTSNANDAGFLIERGSTGDNAIFMWDESADKFTLGTTTATGTTTGDITLSSTGTLVANVEGAITGDVTGNADTATALATARNFSLTGDVTAGAISFDGSGNVALATTIAANSVALGTDTTGNYMSDLTEGTGIDISHTPAEGSNGTITLDLTEVGFGGGANRLITDDGDGTVSTEANLTFDGSTLALTGDLNVGSGDFFVDDSAGNVGIGTVSPNRLLHLQSTGDAVMQITSADGSGAYIDLGDVSDVDGGRIVYDSGSNLLFNTASTEKVRITSAGNVGIGTVSPTDTLQVEGSIGVGVGRDGQLTSVNNGLAMRSLVSDADMYFYVNDGGVDTLAMKIDGSDAGTAIFNHDIVFGDGGRAKFGASADFQIVHDSNINFIHSTISDRDIYVRVNDGGSSVDAIIIDASEVGSVLLPNDAQHLKLGAGGDLGFYVNADDSSVIRTWTQDKDLYFYVNDGGVATPAIQIDASDAGTAIFNQDIRLNTNATYIHSKDASGTSTRMFGINGSNTTYIGPIDNYAGGNIIYGANANVDDHDFYTGGTLKMRIKADGNVGIGTASPQTTLHLSNTTTAPILRLGNEDNSIAAGADLGVIQFYSGDDSGGGNAIKSTISSIQPATSPVSGELVFKTTLSTGSLTEAMRIDSSGRLMIGDTSVHYTGVDLQVGSTSDGQNGIQIQTSTTGYGYILFGDGADASAYRGQISYKHGDDFMNFITAGTEAIRIDSSQNVLIGGTSASEHTYGLEVLNDNAYVKGPDGWNGAGDLAIVALGSAAVNENFGCGYKYGTGLILSTYKSGGNGSFGSSSYDALTILDTSGNVGIGTTSPATTLEVDGILTMEDVTAPAEGVAGHAQMFSNSGEMKVNDASGNITTISPHNFELIPGGASEDMAFSYHSMKNTPEGKLKKVNVDMMKLARLVEELTGEKLVYIDEQ